MIVDKKSEIVKILPNKRNGKIDLIIKPYGQLGKIKCTVVDEKIKRRVHLYKDGDIARIIFKIEAKPYRQTNSWTNYTTVLELM